MYKQKNKQVFVFDVIADNLFVYSLGNDMPAWRNGLARWTSNPKVVGSNPTVGAFWKNTIAILEEREL